MRHGVLCHIYVCPIYIHVAGEITDFNGNNLTLFMKMCNGCLH